MKFFSKNKYTIAVIIVFTILAVVGGTVYKTFFSNANGPLYERRVPDLADHNVSAVEVGKIKNSIEALDSINSDVSIDIKGKLINVIITVKADTALANAKELATRILDYFNKEIISYYDVQIFIKNEDKENASYPIIGYKNVNSSEFSYTADR